MKKSGNLPSSGYKKSGESTFVKRKFHRSGGTSDRSRSRAEGDHIDELFGFHRYTQGEERLGWLLNYMPMTLPDGNGLEKAGLDLYFIDREGQNFKASILYDPYFYVDVDDSSRYLEVANYLSRKFEGCLTSIVEKEDLDLPNHLAGIKRKLIKISFNTVTELIETKNKLRAIIELNKKKQASLLVEEKREVVLDPLMCLNDMREYDVPYVMRVSIDLDIRIGAWFIVSPIPGMDICAVEWQREFLELCEPRVLAFDIECEKSPLKFPNAEHDKIFMISYMISNQGYLIINREIVSKDVEDFEYTPKPSFPGPFKVFNMGNEEAMLRKFISHVQELKPHILVTYNGDRFDWPYVESRCSKFANLNLYASLGIRSVQTTSDLASDAEYTGRCLVHLDAFCWVQRDSYLPQGNQGLKSVTKYKLGYDPVEVDPEDMVKFAREKPDHMASYSVSDAVATFYLYNTFVHNFIFSLATIIPLGPEEVLRKGSGTLCEALLMVQAYQNNIICPNKQVDDLESFHNGHLLESETYIGGHVECLEAGVFRADIPVKFTLVPSAFQQLLDHIDRDLTFAIEVEHGLQRSEISNYDTVKQYIVERLEMLRDSPNRFESPVIYHLDVGAMYPNIILTNRLQPSAIVSVEDCAACKFNQASNECKRPMTWTWRGEYSPAGSAEYNSVKRQLAYEKHVDTLTDDPKSFAEFTEKQQTLMIKTRLKQYSQRAYRKTKVTEIEDKTSTVCMREHSFYVDTVKAFRDRRYDYKLYTKTWKTKKLEAEKKGDAAGRKLAEDREVLMDSLQLAHKCILNSFYGYVMRKGARWRSMEMAGIVTYTGAQLIRQARELVEQVGRPLELDTDGIWCILPASFPQDVKFKTVSGGSVPIAYPCAMLNADVHERYTNHQYQILDPKDPTKSNFLTYSECSIFFELDGPYKAMVLPASPEEGKLLKKKYVVYNFNGTIAELKGFELKRRGELELVKLFQSQVFEHFLAGKTLEECYEAVGAVANQWLDVLDEKGVSMDDEELLHLISEKKTISKTVEDYEGRKSTSLTTAGRLADFLGADMIKDKGLNCNLVISRLPSGAPTTERAIPVAIFSCDPAMRRFFLRKWLKDNTLECEDFREVIDWEYYKDRLGKAIQKIVTIPAGMQAVKNPCPRVEHPTWIARELSSKGSGKRQISLQDAFKTMTIKKSLVGRKAWGSPMKPLLNGRSNKKRGIGEESGANDDLLLDLEDFGKPKSLQKFSSKIVSSPSQIVEYEDDNYDIIIEESFPADANEPVEELKSVENQASILNVPSIMTSPPTTVDSFQKWLETRKKQWNSAKINRKLQAIQSGGNPFNKKSTGVLDFVRNAAKSAKYSTWQIIEVQDLDQPGEFLVWAMTSFNQLQRLKLVIPRILYVNIIKAGKDALNAALKLGGKKVNKELPHGKEVYELYEISLSESTFQRNAKYLDRFFHCSEVEGVYESQVPLWFRSVLKLGCVAKVNPSAIHDHNAANGKYHFNDLEMVHTKYHPYLHSKSAIYKRIFLYYAANQTKSIGAIGILGIFAIKTTNVEEEKLMENIVNRLVKQQQEGKETAGQLSGEEIEGLLEPLSAKAYIWIVRGKTGVNMMSKPPFNRIYRKYQSEESVEVKFMTNFVATPEEAFKAANHRLELIYRERNGPTIIVAQGGVQQREVANPIAVVGSASYSSYGFDKKQWRHSLPALQEFPLTVMPTNSIDDSFPAVGWQYFIAEKMIQRFLLFPKWFKEKLLASRYSSIPIGNLNHHDSLTEIMDVSYGRQLMQQRHILWASESTGQPDLGQGSGAEQDLWSVWSDPQKEPVINCPGIYRSICVEIDIFGLAVCSIMSSHELDAEGLISTSSMPVQASADGFFDVLGAAVGKESNNGADSTSHYQSASSFSESGCGKAFNVLKAIITKCIEEVSTGQADSGTILLSDQLLNNIYRYLCGYGHGYLTDPLIHRIVYGLMIKLFYKIIASFKELGSKIIYANLNKIIINTHHYTVSSAKEYMEFILNALSMIWVDSENWCALQPLEEFEALQQSRAIELEQRREERQIQLQLQFEQEAKEKEEREKALSEYQRLSEKSTKKKNNKQKSFANFFGNSMDYDKEEEEEEEEKNEKEDYSFLDDVNANTSKNGEINLKQIKQQTRRAAPIATRYDSDSFSDADDDFDEEGLEEEDGGSGIGESENKKDYYDYLERKEQTRKKPAKSSRHGKKLGHRYNSIEELLDTFDDSTLNRSSAILAAEGEEETEERASPLIQHWNMINHLPESAIVQFQYTIEEFVFQHVSCQKALLGDQEPNSFKLNDQEENFNNSKKYFEKNELLMNQILEHLKIWITQFLTNKLLTITDDLQITFSSSSSHYFENNPFILYHKENQEMIQYTSLAERQYYQNIKSVAFEFVKAISFVFLLDGSLKESVLSMRRLLLAQLHEQEFSIESDFRNPNLTYILPDVICSYCSLCRDIDLLRDDSLVLVDSTDRWKCVNCQNRLNIEEIENRLLTEVNKLTTRFYLQDFHCPKTHLVSKQLSGMYSIYNAERLSMNLTVAEMKKQLLIFFKIANIYHFDYLQLIVEELLQK